MALLARRVARLHKTVGLVAGILLLSWTASGLFFTIYPIETIRGDPWRPAIDHGNLSDMSITVSAEEALAKIDEPATQIRLKAFLNAPVWMIESDASRAMIDATTGAVRSPLPQSDIDAMAALFGDKPDGLGTLTVAYLIQENPLREYAGPMPAWVLEYEPGKQRIYIDAISGDVRSVRTTRWRIFDVLWRFHILDVTGENRFDSWWLKLAAFLGLTMVLSGLVLGIDRIRKGRLFS
ncbi:MAG: PepSY domain-containing protein [Hyphomonas sp.]|nr:PepSY domain-containing protein [Hyphomonas sp.]